MNKKMTISEFGEYVIDNINYWIGADGLSAEFNIQLMDKGNGIKLHGLTMKITNAKIAPVIYLEEFYKLYEEDKKDLNEILDLLATLINRERDKINGFRLPALDEFENVKDKIYFRLCDTTLQSEEFISNTAIIHPWADNANTYVIVFYMKIDTENPDIFGKARITWKMLDTWNIEVDELYTIALTNFINNNNNISFKSMLETLTNLMSNDLLISDEEIMNSPLYVLMDKHNLYGAAIIALPNTLDCVYDYLGGREYYILPSSVHEVLIMPVTPDMPEDDVKNMVSSINETILEPEELLSNTVLKYDGTKITRI